MNYEKIIKECGTPTYVYDISILKKRINYLKSMFKNYNLVYAVKANSFIVKEIINDVERFEICSFGEFEICNNLGVPHEKMVISGVYKNKEKLEYIISNFDNIGKFTIESINQFNLLKDLTEKYNKSIDVLIRLTSGNQFGVSEEDFKYILKNNNKYINICGIEFFSGTQKHSIKRIKREIDYLIEFTNNIEKEYDFELKEIEYGPGLPIFYFQDDNFDEEEFLNEINEYSRNIKNKVISLEIGRSITASCGSYLTKVVDIKTNKNGNFALIDGGINHLVYYGQTMAMRVPHFELVPKRDENEEIYNLCGSLCTVNDIIVKNISVNKLKLNDVFVFKNVGAYSSTEGISLFLSRDLPKVAIYKEDGSIIVVRDFTKTSTINFPNYEVKE